MSQSNGLRVTMEEGGGVRILIYPKILLLPKVHSSHTQDMNETKAIEFIELLARESGAIILESFANPELVIETKSDQSPVTIADRKSEEIMRGLISRHFPEHGIIGEEFGSENEEARFVWVLDPIDGTKPFVSGCPLFGTLICLLEEGKPIVGAINNPVTRQILIGNNRRTTLNGKTVRVRPTRQLEDSILLASNLRSPGDIQDGEKWDHLVKQVKELYTWGDCYGYLILAAGGADIMVDPIMNSWDLLALIPVIRGAGGEISDWHGKDPVVGNSIVAANPTIHPQVIEILNS